MRQIISSIDIGSSSIKIVVGEMVKNKLNILAVSDTPSLGINKGLIVNAKDFIDSLKKGLNKAEETIGLKIKKTIVNIPANMLIFILLKEVRQLQMKIILLQAMILPEHFKDVYIINLNLQRN